MTPHPVHFHVEPPHSSARLQLVIRLVLLIALGTLGWSSFYWLLYLALPALVALRLSQVGAGRYQTEDASDLTRLLRWLAALLAYLWLLSDDLPSTAVSDRFEFSIRSEGTPDPGSALLRLVLSLPALLVLVVLSMLAGAAWLIGAVCIAFAARLPSPIAEFLSLTLRYQFRLAAYHLSLVDRYPSYEDSGASHFGPSEAAGH